MEDSLPTNGGTGWTASIGNATGVSITVTLRVICDTATNPDAAAATAGAARRASVFTRPTKLSR